MTADRLSALWAQPNQMPTFAPAEWETVLGQALNARLSARLARHFMDHGWLDLVPPQPRQYLQGALRLADRQAREVHWEVHCIARALKHVDSPIVLLKGAAYLLAGLPASRGRIFSDVDIMVRPERLPEVEGALFAAGWISEERDAYNERYYRQWMHEIPPMKHVQRQSMIDVHHTITPPTSRFKVAGSKLFDRIVAIDEERRLFVLAPTDMVLHSAVHLFQEGEFSHGLRDLLDLKHLLEHFGQDTAFWNALFTRARELGLGEPLYHALHHIRRLWGAVVPTELQSEIRNIAPSAWRRWIMGTLLQLALQPQHPSCDTRRSATARWLLYVRSHYLRMPWYLVVPHLVRKAWMKYHPEKK